MGANVRLYLTNVIINEDLIITSGAGGAGGAGGNGW